MIESGSLVWKRFQEKTNDKSVPGSSWNGRRGDAISASNGSGSIAPSNNVCQDQPAIAQGDAPGEPRPGRPGHIGPSDCRALCRAWCTPVLHLPFHGLYTVRPYHLKYHSIISSAYCKLMTLGALKARWCEMTPVLNRSSKFLHTYMYMTTSQYNTLYGSILGILIIFTSVSQIHREL